MKTLISLSGGLDSAVLLAEICRSSREEQVRENIAVSFNYGSTHNKYELAAAEKLCEHYMIEHMVYNVEDLFKPLKSALLDGNTANIPEGHYEEESMRQTVVPGRNMVFISALTGLAITHGANIIYLGVHAGDHFIYPDCRPDFIAAMRTAVAHASEGLVHLHCPFLKFTKDKIVQLGANLKTPFWKTRTCYKPQETACGKCGSCQERLAAFAANKIDDPLTYESREIFPKKT